MAFKLRSGNRTNFKNMGSSPIKQKGHSKKQNEQQHVVIDGKTYPKGYTKEDVKFLKEQHEDVVRYEDLDAKGKAIWKKQGKPIPTAPGKPKKSPAKSTNKEETTEALKKRLKREKTERKALLDANTPEKRYDMYANYPFIKEGGKVARVDKKKSPAKQEGPLPKENIKLQKTEHKDTWVYKGKNKQERIMDLEDRIGFIDEDVHRSGKPKTRQQSKDQAKLKQELAILRKSKHK